MQFPELNYEFSYNIIELDNRHTIAYREEGTGPQTLLFIHGLASYMPAWNRNISYLKQYYRCIAIDLPGYGKSSAKDHPGTVAFYTAIIKSFIEKCNLGQVTLVGHSMGGHLALAVALKYPSLVKNINVHILTSSIQEADKERTNRYSFIRSYINKPLSENTINEINQV